MDRAQKEKVVDELGQIFESSGVVVVAHYAGLTVAEMQTCGARATQVELFVLPKTGSPRSPLRVSHAQALPTF